MGLEYGLTKSKHNMKIIQANLDIPWNFEEFSANPNITWEIIQENPAILWDWDKISVNQSITWEIIRANPNRPWNWFFVSCNPNITWEIIQANFNDERWNWSGISYNPNISLDIVEANLNLPWNWVCIAKNPRMYHDYFQSRAYRESQTHKQMFEIKENLISKSNHPKRILWNDGEILDESHPLYGMSQADINRLYSESESDMKRRFANNGYAPNSKYGFLSKFFKSEKRQTVKPKQELKQTKDYSTIKVKTLMDLVLKYPNERWDWEGLSRNPNISMKDIESNLDKNWDFDIMDLNPNISCEFYVKYAKRGPSLSPNLTTDFLLKN